MRLILSGVLIRRVSVLWKSWKTTIYPAVEHTGDKDMVSFLDYFPEKRTIIFLDEPNRLTEKGGAVEEGTDGI